MLLIGSNLSHVLPVGEFCDFRGGEQVEKSHRVSEPTHTSRSVNPRSVGPCCVFSQGHAGAALENHVELTGAAEPAVHGDLLEAELADFAQERLGLLNAQLSDVGVGRGAQLFLEGHLQPAARNRNPADDVLDANRLAQLLVNEPDRLGKRIAVVDGERIR